MNSKREIGYFTNIPLSITKYPPRPGTRLQDAGIFIYLGFLDTEREMSAAFDCLAGTNTLK